MLMISYVKSGYQNPTLHAPWRRDQRTCIFIVAYSVRRSSHADLRRGGQLKRVESHKCLPFGARFDPQAPILTIEMIYLWEFSDGKAIGLV